MALSFNKVLLDQIDETVERLGLNEYADQKIETLREKGLTDLEIDSYLRRRYGLPMSFRDRRAKEKLSEPAPEM